MKIYEEYFASTPIPPYYAVIFTSIKNGIDGEYSEAAEHMIELAKKEEGFLGYESAGAEFGITVSYWKNLESVKRWKENPEHMAAQKNGKEKWYKAYRIRITKVERETDFERE